MLKSFLKTSGRACTPGGEVTAIREVAIVDAVRTPIGCARREQAYYSDVRGDELSVTCVNRLLERSPALNPAEIEDLVWAALTSRTSRVSTSGG
jgi:acetyl-CoA acetyltransferase